MFVDDPRAIKENGKYIPTYSGHVMIGRQMTNQEAQEMYRRDCAMDYRKTYGSSEDKVTKNILAYQKRRRAKLKAEKEAKNV